MTAQQKSDIIYAIAQRILSNSVCYDNCGIVVAGYGNIELYPSLVSYETEGSVLDVFKIKLIKNCAISSEIPSEILPFAQDVAANLFINGIDGDFQSFIEENVQDLIVGIADSAANHFGISDQNSIDVFKVILQTEAQEFVKKVRTYRRRTFTVPLKNVVGFLDKAELATLAENLVGLAALKQKVSLELESVGGPVDVAVISKHDGFIWIKRKHYFPKELNPAFSRNIANK